MYRYVCNACDFEQPDEFAVCPECGGDIIETYRLARVDRYETPDGAQEDYIWVRTPHPEDTL